MIYPLSVGLPGRLLMSACPSPGVALRQSLRSFAFRGAGTVVSLLPAEEAIELQLAEEACLAEKEGLRFRSFPIKDRSVPARVVDMVPLLDELLKHLLAGEHVVVHCRAGIGRTGLVACGVVIWLGKEPEEARALVSRARGQPVPENAMQHRYLDAIAALRMS